MPILFSKTKNSENSRAMLSEYVETEDGNLVIKLIDRKYRTKVSGILEITSDSFYFDQHMKNPFTYKYNKETFSFVIKPGDVSKEKLIGLLLANGLFQNTEVNNNPSSPTHK